MVMLGDLLATVRRDPGELEQWLCHHDPVLAARLTGAAEASGCSPGELLRTAVADFSSEASGEDWATVTSALRNSDDPGAEFVAAVLRWRFHTGALAQGGSDERPT